MLLMIKRDKPLEFSKQREDFRLFAITAHEDQKYDGRPYAYHLAIVEEILSEYGFRDYEYRAAGWLHDIIEDTKCTYQDLYDFYGGDVAAMVWACTGVGENRAARNESIYQKIKEYPKAAPVKVADRLANTTYSLLTRSSMLSKYIKEFYMFGENIKPFMNDTVNHRLMWTKLEEIVIAGKNVLANVEGSR